MAADPKPDQSSLQDVFNLIWRLPVSQAWGFALAVLAALGACVYVGWWSHQILTAQEATELKGKIQTLEARIVTLEGEKAALQKSKDDLEKEKRGLKAVYDLRKEYFEHYVRYEHAKREFERTKSEQAEERLGLARDAFVDLIKAWWLDKSNPDRKVDLGKGDSLLVGFVRFSPFTEGHQWPVPPEIKGLAHKKASK
jgi:hypothetical protein